jgi:hypothetical protein
MLLDLQISVYCFVDYCLSLCHFFLSLHCLSFYSFIRSLHCLSLDLWFIMLTITCSSPQWLIRRWTWAIQCINLHILKLNKMAFKSNILFQKFQIWYPKFRPLNHCGDEHVIVNIIGIYVRLFFNIHNDIFG